MKTKILGFFHIATMDSGGPNRWRTIVNEIESALQQSLDINTELLTKVYIGPECTCFDEGIKDNTLCISAGKNLLQYEGATLRRLWNVCNATEEEFYVYYIHTKGVSYPPNTKSDPWRQHMTNAMILNWEKCVKILDSGEKTCGIMWREGYNHYSGNFWWARASHIRTLEKPLFAINRMYFENWLSPPKACVPEGYPRRPVRKGVAYEKET